MIYQKAYVAGNKS